MILCQPTPCFLVLLQFAPFYIVQPLFLLTWRSCFFCSWCEYPLLSLACYQLFSPCCFTHTKIKLHIYKDNINDISHPVWYTPLGDVVFIMLHTLVVFLYEDSPHHDIWILPCVRNTVPVPPHDIQIFFGQEKTTIFMFIQYMSHIQYVLSGSLVILMWDLETSKNFNNWFYSFW
jgi:hypothetical protein